MRLVETHGGDPKAIAGLHPTVCPWAHIGRFALPGLPETLTWSSLLNLAELLYVKAGKGVLPAPPTSGLVCIGAGGETTKSVERSHVAIRDRLHRSRGLKSVRTGQRFTDGPAPKAAATAVSATPHDGGMPYRALARERPNAAAIAVEPNLEDGYLALMHANGKRNCCDAARAQRA